MKKNKLISKKKKQLNEGWVRTYTIIPARSPAAINQKPKPLTVEEKLSKFFKFLNSDNKISSLIGHIGYYDPSPLKMVDKKYRDLPYYQNLVNDKFNAKVTVAVGTNYDNFGTDKGMPSEEERIQRAIPKLEQIIDRINQILPSNPIFQNIEAKLVNKDFVVGRTHSERNDDGLEYFGVDGFIKFYYKK